MNRDYSNNNPNFTEWAVDAADTGVWSLELATNVFWLNKKTREIFCLPATEEITFQRFLDLVHPEDHAIIEDGIRRAHEEGGTQSVEYRIITPDGAIRWIQAQGTIHNFMGDNSTFLSGVSTDITDRKNRELTVNENLEFEALLSKISASFALFTLPADLDSQIEQRLQLLLDFFKVDRCGLIRMDLQNREFRVTHAAYRKLHHRLPSEFNGTAKFPWAIDQLINGRHCCFSDLAELPTEADVDRQSWQAMGVKSTLQTPLPVSESTVYVIEISSLTDNITWRREVFPRLKTIGAIFLNPLFRKRAEESYHCAYDSILKTTADLRSEVASLRAGMSALTSWAQSVSADHRRKSMLSDKDRGVAPHRLTLEQMERGYIEETLRQTGGRIKGEGGAARILGMNPATLYSRMKKLGITPYCR